MSINEFDVKKLKILRTQFCSSNPWLSILRELSRSLTFLLALVLLTILGTICYHKIEGWSLFDSLYMTVITIASVGFMEVHPLTESGRTLTMILIVLGFGVMTVLYSSIAQVLIQRQFLSAFRDRKMIDAINKLHGHTIFCGYGRLARTAAQALQEVGHMQMVIIEADDEKAERARKDGHLVIVGDATSDDILMRAGILRAARLVAVLAKDADNLYVVLTSRELNSEIFLMARAEDDVGERRLLRAGANRVISPYRVGGQKIAEGLQRPFVHEFMELAVSGKRGALQIEEIEIPHGSPLNGKTLAEAALRKRVNIIVAAVISQDGHMNLNPDGDAMIEAGATFIVLGLRPDLIQLEKVLTGE